MLDSRCQISPGASIPISRTPLRKCLVSTPWCGLSNDLSRRTTTPDVNSIAITSDDERIIPQFVSAAHFHSVSASISVGGWAGSLYFSTAVATAANRTAFIKTLSNFVNKYKFDGIDFE